MSHTMDEEYEKLLERIVTGANFLDHPLIKPTDYERGLKKYDRLCAEAMEMRNANG